MSTRKQPFADPRFRWCETALVVVLIGLAGLADRYTPFALSQHGRFVIGVDMKRLVNLLTFQGARELLNELVERSNAINPVGIEHACGNRGVKTALTR